MPTTGHNTYSILSGEDYSLINPTTLFCITDQKLLPNATEEFYSKYRLTNVKSHDLYTDKFGINVLQLNHIDIATEEDISNNLVFWAKLFNATTWEEFKALAKDHPDIKEVGNLIFELNYDNRAKDLLEGQRRYREQMNSQYTAGYTDAAEKFEQEISKKDATIADNKAIIASRDATIADNKATIAARDATIADKNLEIETLKAKLKEYEQSKK